MKSKRKWVKEDGLSGSLTEKVLNMAGIPMEDRNMFLHGTIADIKSGLEMKDVDIALPIIKDHIRRNARIVMVTDGNDDDGAQGGAVGVMMAKDLGAEKVEYYSNNRFTQGYGMQISSVDEILELYPDVELLITIDNGVAAHEAVDYAKSKGLTVIVTDHHDVPETLPKADAVINPKRKDCPSTFKEICGTTVIWKVLKELYPDKSKANKYLDLVAIATVGDVMSLVSENRIIVKEGLRLMNKETRLSLKILKELTNTTKVTALNTIGFLYVPIVNAVGRLDGNINSVIETIISEDENFIQGQWERFISLNTERKSITEEQTELVELAMDVENIPEFILVYNPTLHEGIVGLIAGRLKEKYNRPTIVLTKAENGLIKGSARSIEGFDMKSNLDLCSDLLGGYGGHPMAAGLSLSEENLEALRDKLTSIAKDILTEEHLVKKYCYVERYAEKDITQALVEEFAELEPFGPGFPKPLIRLDQFKVHRALTMGKEKNHLKLAGENLSVIGWRQAVNYEKRGNPLKVTALGCPELNVFNNKVNVQFMIEGDNFM